MGKALILLGIVMIIIGVLFSFNIPYLGKLPGDIHLSGENYSIYIPITTSIIISIIISLILYLLSILK